MKRDDIIGTTVANIIKLCDENQLVWEWDDQNGGIVIWAKDAPSLYLLMTRPPISEAS